MLASTIGVISGYYIFDPALRQSAKDLNLDPPPSPAEKVKEAIAPDNASRSGVKSPSVVDKIDQLAATKESDSPVELKAREQVNLANANAGKRAADALKERAEKTGEGKVV